tara:strand:- start:130 stop:477 length:348 start_codon:yes stop_codon:yes gene_type:complete
MPCYDDRGEQEHQRTVYIDKLQPEFDALNKQLSTYREYSSKIDAAMCAVLNELEQRCIIESVITKASRHGLIDIVGWWRSHKDDDKSRLTQSLHKYSVDEQRVLFDLLKGQFNDK